MIQFQSYMGLSKLFSRNFFVAVVLLAVTCIIELYISKEKQADEHLTYVQNVSLMLDSVQNLRYIELKESIASRDTFLVKSERRQSELEELRKEFKKCKDAK